MEHDWKKIGLTRELLPQSDTVKCLRCGSIGYRDIMSHQVLGLRQLAASMVIPRSGGQSLQTQNPDVNYSIGNCDEELVREIMES